MEQKNNGIQSIFIFNKNHFLKPKTNKTAAGSWIGGLSVNKKGHSFFFTFEYACVIVLIIAITTPEEH